MSGIVRQTARLWATILVVYALLFAAIVPVVAVAGPAPIGVICTGLANGSPQAPGGGRVDHDMRCCVLCAIPTMAGPPPPVGEPAPPIAAPAPATAAAPVAAAVRAPPQDRPHQPRAPPIEV